MAAVHSEYARKLLTKYGWKEGKGLGRCENGIIKPIKPKLKFNTFGLGHSPGQEFTNDWWVSVYNAASSSVRITENQDEISIKGCKTDLFNISTKEWMINKDIKKKKKLKYNSFLKTSILINNGEIPDKKEIESDTGLVDHNSTSLIEDKDDFIDEKMKKKQRKKNKKDKIKKNLTKTEETLHSKKLKLQGTQDDSNTVSFYKDQLMTDTIKKKDKKRKKEEKHKSASLSENDYEQNESISKQNKCHILTDEELFRICGGRTAHHSARYEGVANGKLARIRAQEEQMMSHNN